MKKCFFKLLSVVVVAMVATACSRNDDNLLDTIPADVDYVATVDFKSFFENAGCTVTDAGCLVLPDEMRHLKYNIPESALKNAGLFMNAVDVEHAAIFGYVNDEPIITFRVKDASLLETMSDDDNALMSSDSSFLTLSYGKLTCLLRDGQCWLLSSDDPVGTVKSTLKKSGKEAVSDDDAAVKMLDREGTANIVVRMGISANENYRACMNIVVGKSKMRFNVSALADDGKTVSVNFLKKVDTSFLRYVPSDAKMIAAVGLSGKDADWDSVALMAELVGGYEARGMAEALQPYFSSIDGTVSVACKPIDRNSENFFDAAAWQYVVLAQMPEETIDTAISQVRGMLGQGGIKAPVINGIMSIKLNGMSFYMGNVGGSLGFSNAPFDPSALNPGKDKFSGHCGALTMSLPSLRSFSDTADFGLDIDMAMESDNADIQISLTGSDRYILPALLSLMQ